MRLFERQVWLLMAGRSHGYGEMLKDKDQENIARVNEAFLKMKGWILPN
jgi:hypothetical protein